ncbi:platelet glycoprotein Ib beta chain [Aulostomus maculatus]
MKQLLLLYLLSVCGGQGSSACPHPCSCHGSRVNCSSRSLDSTSLPPSFPPDTTELLLHNNTLTILPNGLLDNLPLRSLTLQGNPWVCDCGVLYLRALLRRRPESHTPHLGVNCSFPPSLRGRLVVYLTEEEVLESCHYWYCDLAIVSQVVLSVFVGLQGFLVMAIFIYLRKFERLSKEAKRTIEESFTSEDNEWTPLKTAASDCVY